MKKTVLIPTVLCGVLLATSAMSFPWGGNGSRGADGPRGQRGMQQAVTLEQHEARVADQLKRMSTLLELTDQQQAQLKEIFDAQYQERTKMREEMQASRDALLAYRLNDQFDENEYRALVEKQADLRTEMRVDREVQRNAVESVLTAEQQEKLDKLYSMRGDRGQRGHGGKDGRGGQNAKAGTGGRGGQGADGGRFGMW